MEALMPVLRLLALPVLIIAAWLAHERHWRRYAPTAGRISPDGARRNGEL